MILLRILVRAPPNRIHWIHARFKLVAYVQIPLINLYLRARVDTQRLTCLLWHITAEKWVGVNMRYALPKTLVLKSNKRATSINNPSVETSRHL